MTYDEAGRLKTSETKSSTSEDAGVPAVQNSYSSATGLLVEQSTPSNGKVITSKFTTLGQLESYTDADGNTAKDSYEEPDGLIKEMRDSSEKGETYQRYIYDPTSKALTSLTDSGAGIFTASYDAEGKMTSEVYPTRCAPTRPITRSARLPASNTSRRPTAQKNTRRSGTARKSSRRFTVKLCRRTTPWPKPNTNTTNSDDSPRFRKRPPANIARRGSMNTTRNPTASARSRLGPTPKENARAKAPKNTTSTMKRTVLSTRVSHMTRWTIQLLPATDAGGQELKSALYVDNQVATQTQNGKTLTYGLDPSGRVRETTCTSEKTVCEGGKSSSTTTHYDAPGEAVAWTSEAGLETRNIPGIDGELCAVEKHGAPAVLQMHDLQGDIVATASLSASATEPASSYNSTEFGVPNENKTPPKYAWLGGAGVASELPSGVVTNGAVSYVPETGRALQTEQVAPPGLAYGSGAGKP